MELFITLLLIRIFKNNVFINYFFDVIFGRFSVSAYISLDFIF